MMDFFLRIKNFFLEHLQIIFEDEEEKENVEKIENNFEVLNLETEETDKKIKLGKRTISKRLYVLEQEIKFAEKSFPEEYKNFLKRIQNLKNVYFQTLNDSQKDFTFEIDPEIDGSKTGEIVKLERDVEYFLNKQVRFSFISEKIQNLIVKLNILYNVSIVHNKKDEKDKAISQVKKAENRLFEILKEFEQCDLILMDKQLKERLVDLMSYAEYLILKVMIRNSNDVPENIIKNLTLVNNFRDFNYRNAFFAFISEEISVELCGKTFSFDDDLRRILDKQKEEILAKVFYEKDFLFKKQFWKEFLNYETTVITMLNDKTGQKQRVNLLVTMKIEIGEEDVLDIPLTETKFELTKIFATNHESKVLLMLKFLEGLSNGVNFKEIYFLLLMFDTLQFVEEQPNELQKDIKKYAEKYQYSREEVAKKREKVCNSKNVNLEYLLAFTLNEDIKGVFDVIEELKNLNFDFLILENQVFINSFYFEGLPNVSKCLRENTDLHGNENI